MGALQAQSRLFCFLLMIFCIINPSSLWAVKKASIIICAETGKVLHENNADAVTPPASLTKMMTLYLTFKALREKRLTFEQKLPVSKRASLAAPCKLWLKPGAVITVRDAILGMVTKSANDASIAVAEKLAKSESQFAALMTQQARRLGMSKTVFKNSHGLPEKQQSITTARDMAILSQRLYKDFPEYFKFFKEPKFAYKGHVHQNHNRLLGKIPGLDGIKTGFINASGFNLAASVVRDNRRIIAVVMGGKSAIARDKEMVKLLEATYSNLRGEKGSSKGKKLTAVHRSQSKPKIIKTKASTKYRDVRHLLNDLDQQTSSLKIKKSSKKGLQKKSKSTLKPVSKKKKKVSKLHTA
ncbi:MAG: D-alanyl-D-alanine carboxypeptidase [Alphaproteobacteria bacterium]|nr:D-alanyl-D-alanine carboxypeptidase [Alphaproteobacteria bacterium]